MPPKRVRVVQGSCWPCKHRRVLCDLQKPACKKCAGAELECNFDKYILKWGHGLASRGRFVGQKLPIDRTLAVDSSIRPIERRFLDYFESIIWPLLSISHQPSPAPMSTVLECQPLRLSMCALAATHNSIRVNAFQGSQEARLACLGSLRRHLKNGHVDAKTLTPLLMASILLCILDGFLAPQDLSAATAEHHAGVMAIIDSLGGSAEILANGGPQVIMLFSEFVSMDLTRALITGKVPYLQPELWEQFPVDGAWWGDSGKPESMAQIFEVMASMAIYAGNCRNELEILSIERIREYELSLRPNFTMVDFTDPEGPENLIDIEETVQILHVQSLCRSFKHAGLIYLYREICQLPTHHAAVQREVHECIEASSVLSKHSKVLNCALFPLCIAGVHAVSDGHRRSVLEDLRKIEQNLGFGSIDWLCKSLETLWQPGGQAGDWLSLFRDFGLQLFIL